MHYADYKLQDIDDIFSGEQLQQTQKLDAYHFQSNVFLNSGKGSFITKTLPLEAQLSPMYA
ncbi:hypothetical protein NL389_38470, partial [Klebsiella pneumoniae]|nr:hypothetical protein [Klebsiella pneumoniae]